MGLSPITRNSCSTEIASVHAGAENRAAIHLQPCARLCQRLITPFDPFSEEMFQIWVENTEFPH
jgi:hypothetical protein